MTYKDDRNDEQHKTHLYAVAGTDKFMSGWGGANGGSSVAAWACTLDDLHLVEKWVGERKDMRRVRTVKLSEWRPKAAHVHVYVVDDKHPSVSWARANRAPVKP